MSRLITKSLPFSLVVAFAIAPAAATAHGLEEFNCEDNSKKISLKASHDEATESHQLSLQEGKKVLYSNKKVKLTTVDEIRGQDVVDAVKFEDKDFKMDISFSHSKGESRKGTADIMIKGKKMTLTCVGEFEESHHD